MADGVEWGEKCVVGRPRLRFPWLAFGVYRAY